MECNELHDFQRATKTRKGIDKENIRSGGATKDAQGLHYWRQAQRELSSLQLFRFSIPELDSSLFSPSPNNSWPKKKMDLIKGKRAGSRIQRQSSFFSNEVQIFAFDVAENRLISLCNARKLNRRKRGRTFLKDIRTSPLHEQTFNLNFPSLHFILAPFFSFFFCSLSPSLLLYPDSRSRPRVRDCIIN